MLKRTISGACFVAIISVFLLLRQFVDYRIFNFLICFVCAVGTFEIARALKGFSLKGIYLLAIIFGVIFVPHFCVIEYFVKQNYGWLFSLSLIGLTIILVAVYSVIKKAKFNIFISSVLPFIYPSILLLCLLLVNELEFMLGFTGILLVFVISSLTDTFAYLVGMTYGKIRKGKVKKLCPKLSPNKTWAGAIGGTIGGVVGAIIIYFIWTPKVNFCSPILLFIIVGFIGAIATQVGDLFESFIKRKVGIKDMGKIMPGHGGVMDRIDGMIFVSLIIFIAFTLFS